MTTPSPNFTIDGGGVGVKAAVDVGATVTCLLDSTSGVKSTVWSIIRTDESTTTAQWDTTFVQTGSVGQQVTFTALTAGTACIVQAEINGGLIAGQPSSASRTTAKVYVLTGAGFELLTDDELVNTALEASATHGAVTPINATIRAGGYNDTEDTKIAAYDAVIDDLIRVDPTAGGFAITLPTAIGVKNRGITVKNVGTSANAVTFTTTAAQTIDALGSGADSIAVAWGHVTFISDNSNWMRFPKA